MSAAANLAGFFPTDVNSTWNEYLQWQPIPIHTIPTEMDYILLDKRSCPRFNQELKSYKKSSKYKTLNRRFKLTYQYLEEHSGKDIKNIQSALNLYDTLLIENLKNKT